MAKVTKKEMSTGPRVEGEFLAPWRNMSLIENSGDIIYYVPERNHGCISCGPSSSTALIRHFTRLHDFQEQYPDVPTNNCLHGKRVLIIVNPKSGTGAASKMKSNIEDVTTILSEAGLQSVVRYTERPRHAVEIIKEYGVEELSKFVAVASVGGDGTLHEVINGLSEAVLMDNSTSPAWNKMPPIAIVPGGSGNAIAVSTGIPSAKHAALNIVHGLRSSGAIPATLLNFTSPPKSENQRLAIGGIQWGFTADVDQGTENLRWMGDIRFILGSIVRIGKKKSSHARISVVIHPDKNATLQEAISNGAVKRGKKDKHDLQNWGEQVEQDTYVLDDDFMMVVAWNSSMIGDGFMMTPHAKVTELGVFDFIAFRSDISRGDMLEVLLSCEDGSFIQKSNKYIYLKAKSITFEDIAGEYLTVDGEAVPVTSFSLDADCGDRLRILDTFSPQ